MKSQQTFNTNIVANFLNFPMVIHMLQLDYYSGVMIFGSWGAAQIQFWTDRDTWANLGFELTSNGKLTEPGMQRL
jgi:hypothetical protein